MGARVVSNSGKTVEVICGRALIKQVQAVILKAVSVFALHLFRHSVMQKIYSERRLCAFTSQFRRVSKLHVKHIATRCD